ncbi:TetR family transcriptional regulator [Kineococcus terrestris]|uniref:TetR family transcriptional regulator n=1 Tax=Kineococcus terrestris TaxID=2044856 RepID=UPI0034DB79DF
MTRITPEVVPPGETAEAPAQLTAKQRQALATRTRLLAAAFEEFQQHGLAGARVDRIAERAGANKRLIYVYFVDKETLFDTVLEQHLEALIDGVPFAVEDLPTYAADLFDYLEQRPELLRLFTWRTLERGADAASSAPELASYHDKVHAIDAAQRAGAVAGGVPAAHVLAQILALAQFWALAAPALQAVEAVGVARRQLAGRRRRSVYEATLRLTRPAAPRGAGQ